MRDAVPLEWEREAGWALQLCPKSERLPQRWKPDSLQWLLIIQSQFVPSRRARSPAKPPLPAARSKAEPPGVVAAIDATLAGIWELGSPLPPHPGAIPYPWESGATIIPLSRVGDRHPSPLLCAPGLGPAARCARGMGKQPRGAHRAERFQLGRLGWKSASPHPIQAIPSQPRASLAFPHGEAALEISFFSLIQPSLPRTRCIPRLS